MKSEIYKVQIAKLGILCSGEILMVAGSQKLGRESLDIGTAASRHNFQM